MKAQSRRASTGCEVSPRKLTAALIGVLSLVALTNACVATRLNHESVPLTGPLEIRSNAKAHLLDGSTIVYPDGVTIENGQVAGPGIRYDIGVNLVGTVSGIALDSIGAMESFGTSLDVGRTVVLNTLPPVFLAALILVLDAIFE